MTQTTLRRILSQRGIKVTELASLTGIPYHTVSNYVSGKAKEASVTNAILIARALGYSVEEVFPVPELISATNTEQLL